MPFDAVFIMDVHGVTCRVTGRVWFKARCVLVRASSAHPQSVLSTV